METEYQRWRSNDEQTGAKRCSMAVTAQNPAEDMISIRGSQFSHPVDTFI